MRFTDRDKMLALVLPSLFIGLVYGYFFLWGKQIELGKALASRDDARLKSPGLRNQVMHADAQHKAADKSHKQLESEKQDAFAKWEAAIGRCSDPRERNHRVTRLNEVLSDRHLRLLEDTEADGTKDGQAHAALEALFKDTPSMPAREKPQLRKLRLVGRYLDVMAALTDLTDSEVIAIPVGLAMKDASLKTSLREWTLMVWI